MARLNARPSTLSRSPAVSDRENLDPQRRGSAKATVDRPSQRSLPTPTSDSSDSARRQKRKRVVATQPDDVPDDMDEGEAKFNRYFDPNQNPEQRRQVKKRSRALEREFNETRDELLRGPTEGLSEAINRANNVFQRVKQTNDATVDSRLFVNVSDLAHKKTAQLVLGDGSTGIDVDVFLSKCISYMRNGGPAEAQDTMPTRSQRLRTPDEDNDSENDDEDGIGEVLDWETLGRHACFPFNSRPACPYFLLGPLSVERKQRKQTQRSARQTKDTNTKESRPEALTRADLSQNDENGLTAIVGRMEKLLDTHCTRERILMQQKFTTEEEVLSEYGQDWLKRHHIRPDGGMGPWLFDFVLNPDSFGQTVENLFYVSFLIKEGHAGIEMDGQGLPVLTPAQPVEDPAEKRKMNLSRHQSVFSLDYKTWQELIEAFDVREPMIPHRDGDAVPQIGQNGWYT